MRKPTKRSLTRKLDKEVSRIIRLLGKCAKCGSENRLQSAHIFSRKKMSVRFDLDNSVCLCLRCHLYWAHKNPIEFADWIKEYLGAYKYNRLKAKANSIKKWTIEEMQELLETLQQIQ